MYRTTTYTIGPTFIEITVLPGLGREDAIEEAQHQFITDNWASLGAAAYEGFRRFGIGAVIIHETPPSSRPVPHPFVTYQVSYAASFGEWMRTTFADDASKVLDEAFETYDPRESGVFVFVRGEEPPRAYHIESTLRPPQALERARALLN